MLTDFSIYMVRHDSSWRMHASYTTKSWWSFFSMLIYFQADEAKQELKDVVAFLKNPDKFKAIGAKLPKGTFNL